MNYSIASLELLERAKSALPNSYSPYSGFPVGAAVLAGSGRVYSAPNVENASYGLTLCAERNAIFQAIGAGEQHILALVLYTPTKETYTPCGACRQVLAEFAAGDAEVICVSENGASKTFTLDLLLPDRFAL